MELFTESIEEFTLGGHRVLVSPNVRHTEKIYGRDRYELCGV